MLCLDEIRRGTIFIDEISVGMQRELRKVITDVDVEAFGGISGDRNPVHFNDEYARNTVFKGRIVHGMLTAALISAIVGEQLPGHGAIYLSQSLRFRAPVRHGDEVLATVTVAEIISEKRRVMLDCICRVGDTVVLEGEALVLAPARE